MNQSIDIYPADKGELYTLLKKQLAALMQGETRPLPNLCNAAALIFEALPDINWAGFYLMADDGLLLGPFQGKPACIHIAPGRGVCGTAALEDRAIIVEDVHQFSGHIACDSASNSEIVIPLRVDGKVIGVLDIDSPLFSRFDEQDLKGLEDLTRMLASGCDWGAWTV